MEADQPVHPDEQLQYLRCVQDRNEHIPVPTSDVERTLYYLKHVSHPVRNPEYKHL